MGYDNTDTGVLFKNDRKAEDSQPDYTGNINFNGTDCWLSAWLKKDKNGKTYMSLSVQPKEKNYEEGIPEVALPHDDVPF